MNFDEPTEHEHLIPADTAIGRPVWRKLLSMKWDAAVNDCWWWRDNLYWWLMYATTPVDYSVPTDLRERGYGQNNGGDHRHTQMLAIDEIAGWLVRRGRGGIADESPFATSAVTEKAGESGRQRAGGPSANSTHHPRTAKSVGGTDVHDLARNRSFIPMSSVSFFNEPKDVTDHRTWWVWFHNLLVGEEFSLAMIREGGDWALFVSPRHAAALYFQTMRVNYGEDAPDLGGAHSALVPSLRVLGTAGALRAFFEAYPMPAPFVRVKQSPPPMISFIVTGSAGWKLRDYALPNPEIGEADLAVAYGQKFLAFHESLVAALSTPDTSQLTLIHGPTGTGKTSYVRLLSSVLRQHRRLVFLSPALLGALADPAFAEFLLDTLGKPTRDGRSTLLVVEDAEPALVPKQGQDRTTAAATLLSLTDGLVAAVTKISVLITFNVDLQKIDSAITRTGRQLGSWHFDRMGIAAAKELAAHFGRDPSTIIGMSGSWSLAEVLCLPPIGNGQEVRKPRVGFDR